MLDPPPMSRAYPKWLSGQEATLVITGGMGARAQSMFADNGVSVITGAPAVAPEEVVTRYLEGTLETGATFVTTDHCCMSSLAPPALPGTV